LEDLESMGCTFRAKGIYTVFMFDEFGEETLEAWFDSHGIDFLHNYLHKVLEQQLYKGSYDYDLDR